MSHDRHSRHVAHSSIRYLVRPHIHARPPEQKEQRSHTSARSGGKNPNVSAARAEELMHASAGGWRGGVANSSVSWWHDVAPAGRSRAQTNSRKNYFAAMNIEENLMRIIFFV